MRGDAPEGSGGSYHSLCETKNLQVSVPIVRQAILELLEEGERNMANTLLKDVIAVRS